MFLQTHTSYRGYSEDMGCINQSVSYSAEDPSIAKILKPKASTYGILEV